MLNENHLSSALPLGRVHHDIEWADVVDISRGVLNDWSRMAWSKVLRFSWRQNWWGKNNSYPTSRVQLGVIGNPLEHTVMSQTGTCDPIKLSARHDHSSFPLPYNSLSSPCSTVAHLANCCALGVGATTGDDHHATGCWLIVMVHGTRFRVGTTPGARLSRMLGNQGQDQPR